MLFTNGTVSPPPHSDKNEKDAQSALITAVSFFSMSRVFFLVRLRFSLINNLFLALLRALPCQLARLRKPFGN